ncbi:MAG: dockerin type I repeat-containing protein [Phycisphaerales bacterium]
MRGTLMTALVTGAALVAPASGGAGMASIPLAGLQIRHGVNQSRTSAPDTVGPAFFYDTTVSGMARGVGGALGVLYPNPTPIEEIIAGLTGQPAPALGGRVVNTGGTLPVSAPPFTESGSTVVLGITVNYAVTLSTSIDAAGVVSFSITGVTLSPSILVGYLEFTSGSVVVERVCPGDTNGDDMVTFADLNQVLSGFGQSTLPGEPLLPGDVNGDGVVNFTDLNIVLSGFGGAC